MCGFGCLCVQIIFARRSATLNNLLHRTVDHDPLSPVLELGDLCLQAPQSSLLFSLTSSSRTIHVYHLHHSGLTFAVYHSHHRVSMPARRPTSRHPARSACAPCSQAASPRHPA
jgi:hypothetical protein